MRKTEVPFGRKKFKEIMGRRMAYIDEGEGPPIIFGAWQPNVVVSLA